MPYLQGTEYLHLFWLGSKETDHYFLPISCKTQTLRLSYLPLAINLISQIEHSAPWSLLICKAFLNTSNCRLVLYVQIQWGNNSSSSSTLHYSQGAMEFDFLPIWIQLSHAYFGLHWLLGRGISASSFNEACLKHPFLALLKKHKASLDVLSCFLLKIIQIITIKLTAQT